MSDISVSALGLESSELRDVPSMNTIKTVESNFQITYSAVSAASKLFNESTSKSLRTPISLLQEICSKSHCSPPSYELITTEGQMHQPIFVYKCILSNEFQTIAKGNSKKKAKHSAAMGVLNQIKNVNTENNKPLAEKLDNLIQSINELDMEDMPSSVLNETELDTTKQLVKDNNQDFLSTVSLNMPTTNNSDIANVESIKASLMNCENPVGELIEIAQRFMMRPPEFEYGEEDGPPHNRQFTCFAIFGDYKETGLGRAKKLAKRQAAIKLLFKLKTSGNFNKAPNQIKQESNISDSNLNKANHSKKTPVNIFNQFKTSENPAINHLLNNELDIIGKDLNKAFLDRLAAEEKFTYTIFKLKSLIPNSSNVMIDFNINPHLVMGGYGKTQEDAINLAAFYGLNHIKLMCSRSTKSTKSDS